MANWLDKYENGGEYLGTTNKGFNYNGAWGGPSMQMGGNIQPPMAGAVQTVPMYQMGGYVYPTTFVPQAQTGTRLSPVEEIQYNTWRVGLPKNLQYEGDYDLRGLWKENPNVKPSANLHFTDTYKLPNHPTFSDESKYFNPKTKKYAGHWNETDSSWNYMPYDTTIKKMIVEKKLSMGGNIPGSVGFTYARTQGIPSEGPYAKKTMPSAQKGKVITKREDFEPWWNWASKKAGDVDRRQDAYGKLGDLYAYYAGQPLQYDVLEYSKYKPTNAKNSKANYISINDPKFKQEVFDKYNEVFVNKGAENQTFPTERERDRLKSTKINDNTYAVSGYTSLTDDEYKKVKQKGLDPIKVKGSKHVSNAVGRYFISKGKDEKGDYISYYDTFDEGSGPDGGGVGETLGLTKPFEIYDRIYLDPKTGKPKLQNGGEMQFYQNGLDWTPRNISEYGSEIPMAQPGITQPMRGDIQTRGNQNLLTEIAAQRTKEKKAQEARTRTTIGADKRTAKQKEKDRKAYESKVKYEKEVLGKDFETPQYLQEKDRARAEHLLHLADVGSMGAGLVEGVGKLALKNVPKPVTTPDKITPVVNTTRNLEDLQAAQTFAQKYGYELPTNLERISQSDELTNRMIRGMMDRHNTFVRGVSTNWEAIGKKNPEILRHLEGKGIDWQNNPKAAAEYMATHIPISTGYGRASLNRDVFDQGLEGLYTSNSIPTAEGYTYGQGFITKVKRPTNYSSANRQDWITQNNPEYYEHSLPGGNSLMVDGKITQPINMKLPYLYNVKDYDNVNVFKDKVLKDLEKNASDLKSMFEERALSNPTYSQNLKNSYDEITKRIQDIKAQKWETADVKFDKNLLKTEHLPPTLLNESFFKIGDENFGISKIHNEIVPNLGLSNKEKLELTSDLTSLAEGYRKNKGLNSKQIAEKLKEYLKEQYHNDPYAHYIHLGTPGEKVLEPIKSWEITPEIWKNKSRAHTNKYTKKLSALEEGGVVKDDMGYWNPDNHGKVVEIDSPNITMKGVNQDLIGVSDEGDVQYMTPGNDYKFKGKKVKEYPVAKYGVNQQDEKTVQHLDQLLNFTNKPKAKNGWLDKYN